MQDEHIAHRLLHTLDRDGLMCLCFLFRGYDPSAIDVDRFLLQGCVPALAPLKKSCSLVVGDPDADRYTHGVPSSELGVQCVGALGVQCVYPLEHQGFFI